MAEDSRLFSHGVKQKVREGFSCPLMILNSCLLLFFRSTANWRLVARVLS